MKWVQDLTGRFRERPHYEPGELDAECETTIESVLLRRRRKVEYPVSTEDLLHMLEQVACVDAYADLSSADRDVWGETEFLSGREPRVRISRRLSEDERYENPFRTTITHEFGHVRFHGPLFELYRSQTGLVTPATNNTWICKRDNVEGQARRDWMEWQAGYCSGALLMPKGALGRIVESFVKERGLRGPAVRKDTLEAIELVSAAVKVFSVSRDAATVRLRQLGYLVDGLRE